MLDSTDDLDPNADTYREAKECVKDWPALIRKFDTDSVHISLMTEPHFVSALQNRETAKLGDDLVVWKHIYLVCSQNDQARII